MFRLSLSFLLCVLCHWALVPASAHAQITITGCKSDALQSQLSIQDGNHWTLTGTAARPIQIDCDDMQLFANKVELFQTEGRLIATGDVAFISGESRISSERLDYDTKAKTGIFYNFSGTTVLREKAQPGPFGAQEPNAFFWVKSCTARVRKSSASSVAASPRACSRRRAGTSGPDRSR